MTAFKTILLLTLALSVYSKILVMDTEDLRNLIAENTEAPTRKLYKYSGTCILNNGMVKYGLIDFDTNRLQIGNHHDSNTGQWVPTWLKCNDVRMD